MLITETHVDALASAFANNKTLPDGHLLKDAQLDQLNDIRLRYIEQLELTSPDEGAHLIARLKEL